MSGQSCFASLIRRFSSYQLDIERFFAPGPQVPNLSISGTREREMGPSCSHDDVPWKHGAVRSGVLVRP